MDISWQAQLLYPEGSIDPITSLVRLRTRDVHSALCAENLNALTEWMSQGNSAIPFLKHSLSYSYHIRYVLTRHIEPNVVRHTNMLHHGFSIQTPARRNLYEWTFREILYRCSMNSFGGTLGSLLEYIPDDPDEQWALRIIPRMYSDKPNTHLGPRWAWKLLMKTFNGSVRWVRCFAAFLCSRSGNEDPGFTRRNMVLGWNNWITDERTFELVQTTYPVFSGESIEDVIQKCGTYSSSLRLLKLMYGDILFMGLVWACMNDSDTSGRSQISSDENINRAIQMIFNGHSPEELCFPETSTVEHVQS